MEPVAVRANPIAGAKRPRRRRRKEGEDAEGEEDADDKDDGQHTEEVETPTMVPLFFSASSTKTTASHCRTRVCEHLHPHFRLRKYFRVSFTPAAARLSRHACSTGPDPATSAAHLSTAPRAGGGAPARPAAPDATRNTGAAGGAAEARTFLPSRARRASH